MKKIISKQITEEQRRLGDELIRVFIRDEISPESYLRDFIKTRESVSGNGGSKND